MEFDQIAKLRDDPEGRTKALRDALDKATKAASDAYADFNKAKTGAEQNGVDLLTDDAAFRPIQALHRAHMEAAEKAENARAEYLAGRRRYFTINWIQLAVTWSAFGLFLTALALL